MSFLGTTGPAMKEVTVKYEGLLYRAAMRTDVGRRRTENQDSFGYGLGKGGGLFVVADGMGGARGGGTASAMAVHLILDRAFNADGSLDLDGVEKAISGSNQVIFTRSQEESQLNGMGTTVVAFAILGDRALMAHVGDSRIYRYRNGKLTQLTRDHTLVQELVDSGAIQQEDAASHPIAHMLTRSLGPMANIGVETKLLDDRVQPGDRYLLCSDGLYNHCSRELIEERIAGRSVQEAVDSLVSHALESGGTDNITVQIIEVQSASGAGSPKTKSSEWSGSVDRYIKAEIDVSQVGGVPLAEYARSIPPIAAPEAVPRSTQSSGMEKSGTEKSEVSTSATEPGSKDLPKKDSPTKEREGISPGSQSTSASGASGDKGGDGAKGTRGPGRTAPLKPGSIRGGARERGQSAAQPEEHSQEGRSIEQRKPEQGKPDRGKSSQTKPGQARPEHGKGGKPQHAADRSGAAHSAQALHTSDQAQAIHRELPDFDSVPAHDDEPAFHAQTGARAPSFDPVDDDDLQRGFLREMQTDDYDAGTLPSKRYRDSELGIPRWWSTFLAGALTLVFAAVFYSLLRRDLFAPKAEPGEQARASTSESRPVPRHRAKQPNREAMTDDLFNWNPGSESTEPGEATRPATESVSSGASPSVSIGSAGTESGATESAHAPTPSGEEKLVAGMNVPAGIPEDTSPIDLTAAKKANEDRAREALLAEQIALASSFRVSQAPRLRLGGGSGPVAPMEPIKWEDEAKRVVEISRNAENVKEASQPRLLTDEERRDIAEEKRRAREKISDLDVKLEMLVIENAQDAKTRRVRSEMEAARATEAAEAIQKEIDSAKKTAKEWDRVRETATSAVPIDLVKDLAPLSKDVDESQKRFAETTERYQTAVANWQKPGQPAMTPSELAALGRERKVKQAELEALVVSELQNGPERMKRRIARLQHDLHAVELRRDLLNRHIGMLRAFVPATAVRRRILQDKYLEERAQNVARLTELQAQLDDQDEARFRLEHIELFS